MFVTFFLNDPSTTEIYTSLHTPSLRDALPIYAGFLHNVLDRALHDVSLGVARTHGIDRDALAGGFQRQRTSQPDYAVLGRAIGADVGVTDQAQIGRAHV